MGILFANPTNPITVTVLEIITFLVAATASFDAGTVFDHQKPMYLIMHASEWPESFLPGLPKYLGCVSTH